VTPTKSALGGITRFAVAALAATVASLGSARAAVTCHLEWSEMRDGTRLATEVYLPGDGRYPVILQRTPYSRVPGAPQLASNCDNAQMMTLAAAGYAALNQDVRGRYRSEGVHDALFRYNRAEWYVDLVLAAQRAIEAATGRGDPTTPPDDRR